MQEEVGLLGARQIAYSLKPDVALVVDVTHATDYPTVSKRAARRHQDRAKARPSRTAAAIIPKSWRASKRWRRRRKSRCSTRRCRTRSGTDTDVIFWTRGGIPSALISLPNRYMHSPVEVVSLKDLEQIPQLMAAFALSLKKGEQFKVKI